MREGWIERFFFSLRATIRSVIRWRSWGRRRGKETNRNLADLPVQSFVPGSGMFIFKRDTLMELLFQDVPLPPLSFLPPSLLHLAFMKLRGGLIQRNEGHFHLSSRKTTTYKELWLAAEIPRAEPGCIYFPPREKPFDVPPFYFFLSLSFCHRHDNARPRILESNVSVISRTIIYNDAIMKYYKCIIYLYMDTI